MWVKIRSWLNTTIVISHNLSKLLYPVPLVTIAVSQQKYDASIRLHLVAESFLSSSPQMITSSLCPLGEYYVPNVLPLCQPCALSDGSQGSESTEVDFMCPFGPLVLFKWFEVTLDQRTYFSTALDDGPDLYLPPRTSGVYQFGLEAYTASERANIATASLQIIVSQLDLVPVIFVGNEVDTQTTFVFNTSASQEPDLQEKNLMFLWTCSSCTGPCRAANSRLLQVNCLSMCYFWSSTSASKSEYVFTVSVNTRDGRFSSQDFILNPVKKIQANDSVVLPSSCNAPTRAATALDVTKTLDSGVCGIWPLSGTAFFTTFQVFCSGFAVNSLSYAYGLRIYDQILFLPSSNFQSITVPLPLDDLRYNKSAVTVVVKVKSSSGTVREFETNSVSLSYNDTLFLEIVNNLKAGLKFSVEAGNNQEIQKFCILLGALTYYSPDISDVVLNALEMSWTRSTISADSVQSTFQILFVTLHNDFPLSDHAVGLICKNFDGIMKKSMQSGLILSAFNLDQVFLVLDRILQSTYSRQDLVSNVTSIVPFLAHLALESELNKATGTEANQNVSWSSSQYICGVGKSRTIFNVIATSVVFDELCVLSGAEIYLSVPKSLFYDLRLLDFNKTVNLQLVSFLLPLNTMSLSLILVSRMYSLAISSGTYLEANNVTLTEEIILGIPFNLSTKLKASDILVFGRKESILCLSWAPLESNPVDPGSSWSSNECRVHDLSFAVTVDGSLSTDNGIVFCACKRISAYAVAFGLSPVRFIAPTPSWGSTLDVESGNMLKINLAAVYPLSKTYDTPYIVIRMNPEPTNSWSNVSLISWLGNCTNQSQEAACVFATFTWVPRAKGTSVLDFCLLVQGSIVEIIRVFVNIIFCEHIIRPGETLQQIAMMYQTSWQALFAINQQLRNPNDISSCMQNIFESCNSTGARVQIGRIVQVKKNQSIAGIVQGLSGSFTEVAIHNYHRLNPYSDDTSEETTVFDLNQVHSEAEDICVISMMADECFPL